MPSLRKVKQEAWKFYQKWRKEKTYSPALDCEVRISLKGWRHITGATGHKKRKVDDTYRRLKLLPYAKGIITKSTTIQNVTNRRGTKYYAIEAMIKVKENSRESLRKVRTIIVEDKKKNKIFYSVMDKKTRRKRR